MIYALRRLFKSPNPALKFRNRWITPFIPWLPGLIAALITILFTPFGAWQPLEHLAHNAVVQVRTQVVQPQWNDRVVVIAIDETSLKEYGQFPWSRTRYVQLLQALEPALPAAIGFDILFAEISPDDSTLASALFNSSNSVLAVGADSQGKTIKVVPSLAQVTRQGQIYNQPDQDGISRRSWLYINQVPNLAVAMVQKYNENVHSAIAQGNSGHLLWLPPALPHQAKQQVWLNWLNRTKAIRTVSFVDVVRGKVAPSVFSNKFVLIGITATGFDPLQTPLDQTPPTAGVYAHAAAIDNLLNQRFLMPLPTAANWGLLLMLGVVTNWILIQQNPKGRVITVVGIALLWFAVAVILLHLAHLWLVIAAAWVTIGLTLAGVQLQEQHEKQLLMRLFAQHVAPQTAQMLWQRKSEIFYAGELKPQELVATVLFMDIRDFTTICEKLPPIELLPWVNRYLETMTDCIMDHGGVVDKYIGDAIMAVFGVPLSRTTTAEIQQDALNAIAASLKMNEHLQRLNCEWEIVGKPMIRFGIGIHTGVVIAGSVGGHRRLNYSIMGDTVNVAARLESLNKKVNSHNPYNILISSETLSCLKHQYHTHPVGRYPLKGREKPALIFSILGKI